MRTPLPSEAVPLLATSAHAAAVRRSSYDRVNVRPPVIVTVACKTAAPGAPGVPCAGTVADMSEATTTADAPTANTFRTSARSISASTSQDGLSRRAFIDTKLYSLGRSERLMREYTLSGVGLRDQRSRLPDNPKVSQVRVLSLPERYQRRLPKKCGWV